jgi:hypothetical protein
MQRTKNNSDPDWRIGRPEDDRETARETDFTVFSLGATVKIGIVSA